MNGTINKSCLIALSYFDSTEKVLKESVLAGIVKSADKELGITVLLSSDKSSNAEFIIPTDLSCWFVAPKGEFHTSQEGMKIINPDYLVTWDIHQTKNNTSDGEQQWWQWIPRTNKPKIN
ncbi:hypothetical protein CJF42_18075 [Pseudoalteromonas sp. NBT06-2]|nr:hypothetical protein CJF42_18075 [Pseudoalteromonas sp. NBT06-2]